jgi:predicted metal-binding protein
MLRLRFLASLALVIAPVAALAAAGPAPLPEPDPKTRNMTPYMIQLRTFDACLIIQSRLQNTTREAVHSACSCYASGTIKAMTRAELQAFRETSVFNETARAKALQQIDRCKLQRPV